MFSLREKVALVTGAGSGIGASIARVLAQAGAHVVVTDLQEDAGRSTTDEIARSGGSSQFLPLNVAQEESAAAGAASVHENHGRLDILVNNAGIGHVGTIQQTTAGDLDRLYQVNVRGVFNVTKAFLPRMLE